MARVLIVSLLVLGMLGAPNVAKATLEQRVEASPTAATLWSPETSRAKFVEPAFDLALQRAEAKAGEDGFEFYYTSALGDLDRDGREDLVAHHWRLMASDAGAGYSGTLTLTGLSGDDGARLWRMKREVSNSLPIPLEKARIGPRGTPGALLLVDSHSPTFSLAVIAVDGRGEIRWERSFESTYSYEMPAAATNLPTALDLFDALEGRATDMLIGLLDYADTFARLKVAILDGRDGTLVFRDPAEVGIGAFPTLAAVDDLDLDGKDDYVVAGYSPDQGGHLRAHSGSDGSAVWQQDEVELATPFMWAQGVGPLNADRVPEVAVSAPAEDGEDRFHVVNGENGRVMWTGKGTFPYLLGDRDGDGTKELGVASVWEADDRLGEEVRAYSHTGSLLYQRRYAVERDSCRTSCSVWSFLLDAGDLDNDGLADLFVQRYVDDGQQPREDSYLVSGRDGGKHLQPDQGMPLLASLDSAGDDLARLIRRNSTRPVLTAYDGRDGARLWSTVIRGPVAGPVEPYDSAASITRDRRADLFVTSTPRGKARVTVLDGKDGAVVWSRRI